jgi:ABC-type multidrug transport system ATPase subunit
MNALAIETHSLTKVFSGIRGATRAVDGLSISVPEGAIYGLLGRNSAGKTTTIRMLMGLARPTSGSSRVFGLDPIRERERVAMLRLVGYVPEDKTLLGLTARQLFELNRCFYPETWSDDLARKPLSASSSPSIRLFSSSLWATRPNPLSLPLSRSAHGCSFSTNPLLASIP